MSPFSEVGDPHTHFMEAHTVWRHSQDDEVKVDFGLHVCVNCVRISEQRRSFCLLFIFSVGRQYSPRYAASKLEKLQLVHGYKASSPIFAIFGVVISRNERRSKHVLLFLLGHHFFMRKTKGKNVIYHMLT
jgi:hypothetical protein